MRNLIMTIMADDYKYSSMFRKQYRLSGNLTSLQVKIGTEYYPGAPLRGNAGNNYGKSNNYEFYMNTLKAFNKLNCADELAINPHNMAINWRESLYAYNVGKLLQNYNPGVDPTAYTGASGGPGATDGTRVKGYNTFQSYHAMTVNGSQLGYFYENRVIGKCFFALSFDALNYENTILSGVRTTDAKPFSLLMTYQNSAAAATTTNYGYTYPGGCTIEVFVEYDLVLSFANGEVRALGRS
jgi:hypothetical protein